MSAGDASAPAASKSKKKPAEHPKYSEMIISAIGALKERKGSSRQKIIKCMKEKYSSLDGPSCETHVKLALIRMTKNGQLLQQTGKGASGSFKVAPQPKKDKKPAVKKPKTKKPAAAKPKKKKEATPKKQKTAAKKKKTVKSKKPAEKKKAQKKPTKKPASKTKSAKKSPSKKAPAKKAKKTATKSKSAGSKKKK